MFVTLMWDDYGFSREEMMNYLSYHWLIFSCLKVVAHLKELTYF